MRHFRVPPTFDKLSHSTIFAAISNEQQFHRKIYSRANPEIYERRQHHENRSGRLQHFRRDDRIHGNSAFQATRELFRTKAAVRNDFRVLQKHRSAHLRLRRTHLKIYAAWMPRDFHGTQRQGNQMRDGNAKEND